MVVRWDGIFVKTTRKTDINEYEYERSILEELSLEIFRVHLSFAKFEKAVLHDHNRNVPVRL